MSSRSNLFGNFIQSKGYYFPPKTLETIHHVRPLFLLQVNLKIVCKENFKYEVQERSPANQVFCPSVKNTNTNSNTKYKYKVQERSAANQVSRPSTNFDFICSVLNILEQLKHQPTNLFFLPSTFISSYSDLMMC